MERLISLLKVLFNNSRISVDHVGLRKKLYFGGVMLISSAIIIPCMLIVEMISNIMTEALTSVGAPMNGLLVELHILSAFSVVFGIWVIFNLMFFSLDREILLSLPIKSHEVLLAKFVFSYLAESSIEFLMIACVFIGFFRVYGIRPVSVFAAFLGVFLLPVLPLIYCALIGMVLLTLLKEIKSSKIFNSVSTILMLCFIGLFLASFKNMSAINVDNYVANLSSGKDLFTNSLDKIFFPMPFLIDAIENNSIVSLLIYVFLNILSLAILIIVGSLLYESGLHTVGSLGGNSEKITANFKYTNPKNIIISYFSKELKILLRTRAYANNCVWVNLIWPLGLGLFWLFNRNKETLDMLHRWYSTGNERLYVLMTILIIFVSFILTSMNSIASSTFTREGTHIDFIKYTPVSYANVLIAKALVSIFVSFSTQYAGLIIIGCFFRFRLSQFVLYGLLILCIDIFITLLGLMLDSKRPFTTWSDEYSALRGNVNTFFDMAVTMIIALFTGGLPFLLYHFSFVSLTGFYLFVSLTNIVMFAISISVFFKKALLYLNRL